MAAGKVRLRQGGRRRGRATPLLVGVALGFPGEGRDPEPRPSVTLLVTRRTCYRSHVCLPSDELRICIMTGAFLNRVVKR